VTTIESFIYYILDIFYKDKMVNKNILKIGAIALLGLITCDYHLFKEKTPLNISVSKKQPLENIINASLQNAWGIKDSSFSWREVNKFDAWVNFTLLKSAQYGSNSIIVNKTDKMLYLIKDGKVDSKYSIDLGYSPYEDKQNEGDCRTPEGFYNVAWKRGEGQTKWYKAFLIDYPNKQDKKKGKTGGIIEIHGGGVQGRDWTLGCMAVSNEDMDELFKYIKEGDEVTIVRYTSKKLSD
jgi:murein L,D-transpeptidase YafK